MAEKQSLEAINKSGKGWIEENQKTSKLRRWKILQLWHQHPRASSCFIQCLKVWCYAFVFGWQESYQHHYSSSRVDHSGKTAETSACGQPSANDYSKALLDRIGQSSKHDNVPVHGSSKLYSAGMELSPSWGISEFIYSSCDLYCMYLVN